MESRIKNDKALTAQIAKHLREVYSGGNWTSSNLISNLKSINVEQATQSIHSLNPIATLVFHADYYVGALIKVLQGAPLDVSDKFSFSHAPIVSEEDWKQLKDTAFTNAEILANLIEQMPDSALTENFSDGKYGSNFRNLIGNIEHIHYHLGQIALIRKMLL